MTRRPAPRTGFTLIEMLIVIGIILVLATLAVLFLPNLDRNKGVPNAVTQLQGWINLSKQHALRDGSPRGIRLIHDGNGQCTSLQYIEQPDPVAPRGPGIKIDVRTMPAFDPVLFPGNPGNIGPVTVVTLFQDPAHAVPPGQYPPEMSAAPPVNWLNWDGVQEGDIFELSGNIHAIATIRRFTYPPLPAAPGVPPAPTNAGNRQAQLVLDRVIAGADGVHLSTGFRVIRAPRPLVGEPLLQMHKDVFIDLTACYPCPIGPFNPPNPHPSGLGYQSPFQPPHTFFANWGPQPIPAPKGLADVNYVDILFNSSGFVANAPVGRYVIPVRHRDRPNDIHLVTIYTRTGKIANHPVDDNPANSPYSFTQDGQASGL
jgi:prepilin-type N-terminal cleavage/methylation domain-containing protein